MRISDWSSDVCSSDLSLLQQLELAEADTSKVDTYLALWYQYHRNDNEKAFEYAEKAKQLAATIKYIRGMYTAAYRLGTQSISLRDFEQAKVEFNESIALSKRSEERRVGKECVRTCRYR